MDTCASSHLNSHTRNLSTIFNKCLYPSVHVGDRKIIPVTNTSLSILPTLNRPLYLHNVLVTPNIIKDLIFVRQFTRDNNCTVEFDEFGFSLKNLLTRHILLRCDSSGDLYPVTTPSPIPSALLSVSPTTWHQRLEHPDANVLRSRVSHNIISCNKKKSSQICHACQLGKHVKLPFVSSLTHVSSCFDIIHSDIWTSPIYKARLVANGRSQQIGVDCGDTFSMVVKLATIRVVLSLALSRDGPVHQLDVKNAFFNGMLLTQRKYAMGLLEQAHMVNCNPTQTLVDTKSKLGPDGDPVLDLTLYRSLARGLQYLTFTRPDISCAVQQICLFMHDPWDPHLAALKRVLCYVCGTLDFSLQLYVSPTGSLVAYTDVEWADCPTTRRSTSGYCVFLGDNLLSWSAKRQQTLSRLSVEAEYNDVANVVVESV
ncbi:ribonuclease H-like domain-containing protein [Tanacetum coccineum]